MFKTGILRGLGLGFVWLGLTGLALTSLRHYQNQSGSCGPTPATCPRAAEVTLAANRNTLIMFAHPQCPCTRASIEELKRLLSTGPRNVCAQVWFYKPAGFPADWTHSDLWRSAAAIPGVTVHDDVDGAQAKIFGAETSGYVLLYDRERRLRFRGGITGGRGRIGDNEGVDTVVSLLDNPEAGLAESPVYGCALVTECRTAAVGLIQ